MTGCVQYKGKLSELTGETFKGMTFLCVDSLDEREEDSKGYRNFLLRHPKLECLLVKRMCRGQFVALAARKHIARSFAGHPALRNVDFGTNTLDDKGPRIQHMPSFTRSLHLASDLYKQLVFNDRQDTRRMVVMVQGVYQGAIPLPAELMRAIKEMSRCSLEDAFAA